MKLLVTGASGTVGSAFSAAARQAGHAVLPWPRATLAPWDFDAQAAWLDAQAPDAIVHLAVASQPTGREGEGRLVNVAWSEHLARLAAQRGLPFVFTSTAMVYDAREDGPYTLASAPIASEGYGFEKRQAEHAVLLAHPAGSRIARLGWQIDPGSDQGNQMVANAWREQREHGGIAASTRWRPACSLLADTAVALLRLLREPPGVYLVDSNHGGLNYAELLRAIARRHGFDWTVRAHTDYVHDQRMVDPRLGLPSLAERLA